MLSAFVNAFKIRDLRGKILFTLVIIAVYRLGSFIPIPGVDSGALRQLIDQSAATGAAQLINLFSGGAFSQLAVFALGIMPYITASIIMQLLTVVIPRLEEWQKEGESGAKRINQWTRYLTVGIAVLQSTTLITVIQSGGGAGAGALFGGAQLPEGVNLVPDDSLGMRALMVLTLTAGTAFIMWLGELITARGVGNGMSLIIFVAIISELPSQGNQILQSSGPVVFGVVLLVALLLIVGVVVVEQGQRRIPVQYARRQIGSRSYGGNSTYIPLKVNQSGVIPIIFASSMLYVPVLAASIFSEQTWLVSFVDRYLSGQNINIVYVLTYFVLVVFFAYFYTSITFNPIDVADNMKKYGGFIPGIRPGQRTAEELDRIITRLTLPGSLYLATLAILPFLALGVAGVPFPFAGATLLIVVGVGLETMKQIESQMMQRHYEGFLRR
ncbi:MAG TPA: preprotein translocase subunit SecY [Euzebyales bacterium]|nr:preprotein translocase subunit SecY [Euzebyales bacterium]